VNHALRTPGVLEVRTTAVGFALLAQPWRWEFSIVSDATSGRPCRCARMEGVSYCGNRYAGVRSETSKGQPTPYVSPPGFHRVTILHLENLSISTGLRQRLVINTGGYFDEGGTTTRAGTSCLR